MSYPSQFLQNAVSRIDELLASELVAPIVKEAFSGIRLTVSETVDRCVEFERYLTSAVDTPKVSVQSVYDTNGPGNVDLGLLEEEIVKRSCILRPMFDEGIDFRK